jgi:hypothetical protein
VWCSFDQAATRPTDDLRDELPEQLWLKFPALSEVSSWQNVELAKSEAASWSVQQDVAVVTMTNDIANRVRTAPTRVTFDHITSQRQFINENHKVLASVTDATLMRRVFLWQSFNAAVQSTFPVFDIAQHTPSRMAGHFVACKDLVYTVLKFTHVTALAHATALKLRGPVPQVYYHRNQVRAKKDLASLRALSKLPSASGTNQVCINTGIDSVFAQIFKQLHNFAAHELRPSKPQGSNPHMSFEVIYLDSAQGKLGPYRLALTDVGKELMEVRYKTAAGGLESFDGAIDKSDQLVQIVYTLPLLVMCPNAEARRGANQDQFVVSDHGKLGRDIRSFIVSCIGLVVLVYRADL